MEPFKKYREITLPRFYILSFSFGLPMSLIGCIVFIVMLCTNHKPKKHGYCLYFEVGEKWGGFELGWLFITQKEPSENLKNHELGHAFQNACDLGWAMPFFSIISAVRYWAKRMGAKIDYYAWWFEREANEIGDAIMNVSNY